jgi:hypothetical protein
MTSATRRSACAGAGPSEIAKTNKTKNRSVPTWSPKSQYEQIRRLPEGKWPVCDSGHARVGFKGELGLGGRRSEGGQGGSQSKRSSEAGLAPSGHYED